MSNFLQKLDFQDYLVNVKEALDNLKLLDKKQLPALQRKTIKAVENFGIDNIYFSGNFPAIYFKSVSAFDKKTLSKVVEIHKDIWNQQQAPFLYVYTPTELRIYSCFNSPVKDSSESELKRIEICSYHHHEALHELLIIFSRVAIDSGEIWKSPQYLEKINFHEKVDTYLVNNLINAKKIIISKNVSEDIAHALLTRTLFALYLQDRGATIPEYYENLFGDDKTTDFLDVLNNKSRTYKFFKELERVFNGNLFPVTKEEEKVVNQEILSTIKDCFFGHDVKTGQGVLFRLFDFNIIPVELISRIYEEFLTPESQSNEGAYYTPPELVDFILNEKLPWADENNKNYKVKILDPTCGSGIFLVEAYQRLVDRWEYSHQNQKITFEVLKEILLKSIYGIEKDPEAIKVSAFSLYLTLLNNLNPKSIWDTVEFPYLINNKNKRTKQGTNLFNTNTLEDGAFLKIEYDLVVGNPPFKKGNLGIIPKKYLEDLNFPQELVIAFLHRVTLIAPKAEIALVSTSKILFNNSGPYTCFREFLFKKNYVQAIYNFSVFRNASKKDGGSLFASAIGPVAILFYQAISPPKEAETIFYCAPKTASKSNVSKGLVIDSSDIKYIPREEAENPNSKIWKIAMWGNEEDFKLINNFSLGDSLKDFCNKNKNIWFYGCCLHRPSPNDNKRYDKFLADHKFIPTREIERYYFDTDSYLDLGYNKNYRPIDVNRFLSPMVIFKEGQKNKRFCATYIQEKCVFKNTVFSITTNDKNKYKYQKALVAFLNSIFTSYYLFLTSSSWGIERERIEQEEVLNLPAVIFSFNYKYIDQLADKIDLIINLKKDFSLDDYKLNQLENEIDEIIYEALGLSEIEIQQIKDAVEYSLGLFQDRDKALAYKSASIDEMKQYSTVLCSHLNDFLKFSESSVWGEVFDVNIFSPLEIVALHFNDDCPSGTVKIENSRTTLEQLLSQIDKYTYEKHSQSIYFRKSIRYKKGSTLYIIKPNQKRFWSYSAAHEDGGDIIFEQINVQG